ncbi:MAG: energy transducer TonB [Pyrinomonadaceae bacterium]
MRIFILPLLFLGVLTSVAQTANETTWRTIVSKDNDFSLMLPGEIVIHNDKALDLVNLSATVPGVSFRVMFNRSTSGTAQLNYFKKVKEKEGFVGSQRSGPGFETGIYVAKKKIYRISLYFRTKAGFYSIDVLAKDESDKHLAEFLGSIMVNMTRIAENKGTQPTPMSRTSVEDLQTSQKIKDIQSQKQSNSVRVVNGKQTIDQDIFYSEQLLILNKPRPRYDDRGRMENVQGVVVLQVQFKSTGDIGTVWVVSGPHLLHDVAIEAARKIRFIPAEIDGKAVDIVREVEYSFSIY